VSSGGGRGDFFRDLAFDDRTGTVSVHDSDPFAWGQETRHPRVIQKERVLSAEDHEALARDLMRLAPDMAVLSRAST
jgi:hypothetical protein